MPKDTLHPTRITATDIEITSGTHRLIGKLYEPEGTPSTAVVLNGATGVPQSYYRHFAEWLASEKDYVVLTFDYRDFGASQAVPLRASDATMSIWGIDDQTTTRKWLKARFPDLPLWVIGHSLGALLLSFQEDTNEIDRVIGVASGMAYWPVHPIPYRFLAMVFWFGHVPLITRLLGYLPGKALGLGADLPAKVYWQWRRWCTSSDFYNGDIGRDLPKLGSIEAPVKVIAIADDQMMPPPAVWRLMTAYPNAPKKQLTIRPADYGIDKIGHIGVFAPKCAATWSDIIA